MLMDLLAVSLEEAGVPVWRIHFHRFMEFVHEQLANADRQRDPLDRVAYVIGRRARVLCLDEFHVSDIGDAMILGELLHQLNERKVVLVTTSNTVPDNLYADGLQRARFLPAIERIKSTCDVVSPGCAGRLSLARTVPSSQSNATSRKMLTARPTWPRSFRRWRPEKRSVTSR